MRPALLSCLLALPVYAQDTAESLVEAGVLLGEAGRYREAITRFHAADRLSRRPIHDCNIALAYIGLESLHRAWFFLDRCRREATEPLPAWVGEQHESLLVRLGAGGHGLLAIETAPPGARLAISTLDEEAVVHAPVQLWVPLGRVAVRATHPGFQETPAEMVVEGAAPPPLRVVLDAVRVVRVVPPPPTIEVPEAPSDVWPQVGVWGGSAALLGGAVAFWLALDAQDAAERAHRQGDQGARDAANDDVRLREGLAYGLWALGAAGLSAGLWALATDDASELAVAKQSERAPGPASAAERRGNPPDSLPFSAAEAP
jgi:hypothetical protein